MTSRPKLLSSSRRQSWCEWAPEAAITHPGVTPFQGGDILWAVHNPIITSRINIGRPSRSPLGCTDFKCPFSVQTHQPDF